MGLLVQVLLPKGLFVRALLPQGFHSCDLLPYAVRGIWYPVRLLFVRFPATVLYFAELLLITSSYFTTLQFSHFLFFYFHIVHFHRVK